ncbi:FtsQ-type POTRA domain-containing protein [Bombella sp. TMW 2.2559]|uniref:Cell division protein FtsQ n=1 Tax=Bombella dulcis TaxID=2967339 RepID=A0ABT3WDW1_9PROT|nr:FtsQ-type POTRA domain-containing protein [Bombella dulcis]MCX5615974.1 FtsQ-type POTRA domain-containing protein [Bombella dulcis]
MSFFRERPQEPIDPYGDRPSSMSLFWQRQKIIMRRLSILGLVCLLLAGTGWLAWSSLGGHRLTDSLRVRLAALDPLRIRHIIITGRHLTDESEILEALGTDVNHSLFSFSVETARQRIDELTFVKYSTVERHLPDTINITIEEKNPIAIWQMDGHFVLINQKGDTVSRQELTARNSSVFRKLPLIVGMGANLEADAIISLLNQYPDINSHTLALIRIGQRRWNILMQNGTTLMLPEGAEAAALARLHSYQTNYQLLDRPLKTIDMRLSDRMVIHPAGSVSVTANQDATSVPPPAGD